MNDDVDGILSDTMKIRIDIDNNVVIPSEIFSSRISFIEEELKINQWILALLLSPEHIFFAGFSMVQNESGRLSDFFQNFFKKSFFSGIFVAAQSYPKTLIPEKKKNLNPEKPEITWKSRQSKSAW